MTAPTTYEYSTVDDPNVLRSPFPDIEVPDTDVWSFLAARLRNGESCYVVDNVSEKKYYNAEIVNNVEQIAAYFQSVEVGPGVCVLFIARNSALAALSCLAIFATGATIVPINSWWYTTNDYFCSLIIKTECTYCVCDLEYYQQVVQFTQKHPDILKKLFLINACRNGFVSVEDIIANNKMEYDKPIVDLANDIPFYEFTSGTTGAPKVVMHTHRNVLNMIVSKGLSPIALISETDVFLCNTTITHICGMCYMILSLATNASIVLNDIRSMNAQVFVKIINTFKVTNIMSGPATMYNHIMKNLDASADLSSIKKLIFVGSLITPSVSELVLKRFPNLTSMRSAYAMTEIMGVVASGLPGTFDATTCGVLHPNNRIKIIDTETGKCLERNKTGEIMIWSKGLMKGYLKNQKETDVVIEKDGFLHSGDLGYIDENGNLRIVGRIKELINCLDGDSLAKVFPAELEDILLKHEAVEEAVVLGILSEEHGEAPTACVVLKDEFRKSDKIKNELISLVKQKKSRSGQELFGGVYFFDSLPKTDSGKYLKQKLIAIINTKQSK